ncbi:lysine--tRNA ligase [Myxococcota bacterium]
MQDSPEEQVEQRRRKLKGLREQGINPYPNDFHPQNTAAQVQAVHGEQSAEELEKVDQEYSVAGRVMALRSFGKVAFVKVHDRSGAIQVVVEKNALGDEVFQVFKKFVEVGDIVGAAGPPMRTRTGELSVHAKKLQLLTKSLRPLPEKWHGLKDVEIRYRRRYLDLTVNRDVADVFVLRAKIIRHLRSGLEERGFLEVETPMMHTLAGGATARPFVTHHNALDMQLFMRVAPELFLKRLLVGGLERVYELNRCFRNEGISTQHNPEFTMIEFYQAYATYTDLMELTEELICSLADEVKGARKLSYQGQEIDLTPPFRRVTVHAALGEALGVSAETLGDEAALRKLADQHQVSVADDWSVGKVLMTLFEEKVEPDLIQPTFILDFPLDVSPLSRKKEGRQDLVDRFELYIAGREMANAFSELNDPDDQRERFQAQMEAKAQGDVEAMPYDEDYVRALEYGMPPAGGEGIGIDRLVMLLADVPSIRDVILFPLLRPEQ